MLLSEVLSTLPRPRLVRAVAASVAPVPPLATGTVSRVRFGVVPPELTRGELAVTVVTLPVPTWDQAAPLNW